MKNGWSKTKHVIYCPCFVCGRVVQGRRYINCIPVTVAIYPNRVIVVGLTVTKMFLASNWPLLRFKQLCTEGTFTKIERGLLQGLNPLPFAEKSDSNTATSGPETYKI